MHCAECNKRPATVHFTQIIHGKKAEIHVCELCAAKKGYMQNNEESYSLHDLLSGLFNFEPSQLELQGEHFFEQMEELECPKCHLTLEGFQRIGKFGCADCYKTFHTKLDSIFRRVHSGNTKHHGKIPIRKEGSLNIQKEISHYRKELAELILQERFEQAAVIRDKIKSLENNGAGDDA